MQLFNDPSDDTRTEKPIPGSYEWWYFDACSLDGRTAAVIIFYDGNPFSRRYLAALQSPESAHAVDFPAVSVSIYHDRKPIYYSFLEHPAGHLEVEGNPPALRLGADGFESAAVDGELRYTIRLDQALPSGFGLKGELHFTSQTLRADGRPKTPLPQTGLSPSAGEMAADGAEVFAHRWNLIQERARVNASLELRETGRRGIRRLEFEGLGYHDHNLGHEPMRESFREWYWGRFHGEDCTFLYYLMIRQDGSRDSRNWLLAGDQVHSYSLTRELRHSTTSFGLKPARVLRFEDPRPAGPHPGTRSTQPGTDAMASALARFDVPLGRPIDSGPFYLRYLPSPSHPAPVAGQPSDAHGPLLGIAEYIRPDRIHDRRFWPLVDMRIRYLSEPVHWVQRRRGLYRLTW